MDELGQCGRRSGETRAGSRHLLDLPVAAIDARDQELGIQIERAEAETLILADRFVIGTLRRRRGGDNDIGDAGRLQ